MGPRLRGDDSEGFCKDKNLLAPVLCWARGVARIPSCFSVPRTTGTARRKGHVPDYAGTSRGSLLRATREAPESDAPKPGASASFDAPSRYPGVSLLRVLDRPASVVRLTRQFAGAARGHGCVVHARR